MMDLVYILHARDRSPKFFRQYPTFMYLALRSGAKRFYIKVSSSSYIPDCSMDSKDLVYKMCDNRYPSEVLISNTLIHIYDLKVRVTDLELLYQYFAVEYFNSAYFPDHLMDLVYIR